MKINWFKVITLLFALISLIISGLVAYDNHTTKGQISKLELDLTRVMENLKTNNITLEGNFTMVDEEGNEIYKIYRSNKEVVFEVNGTMVSSYDYK